MTTKYLVLGATGSIGYAFTKELISKGIKVTIFVRRKEKAQELFGNNSLLEVVVGDVINYSGITISSIKYLSEKINGIQGNPKKVKVAPKFILNIIALFSPEVKELKENFYQFENSIILDDDKLKNMYPKVTETRLEIALKTTLDWYENNMK